MLGVGSAIIDNVPLVAASLGMFSEPMDNELWHFHCLFCRYRRKYVIIGSAAGVVAMGMEKIDFFWYSKKNILASPCWLFAGVALAFMVTRAIF
jgi:Na+/H+ antiporter NhaD/arsenite permease-like protein